MTTFKCVYCGKTCPPRKTKYCSNQCRYRFTYDKDSKDPVKMAQLRENSKRFYEANKEKIQPKRSKYFKKWYQKNKEKQRIYMREYMRKRAQEKNKYGSFVPISDVKLSRG